MTGKPEVRERRKAEAAAEREEGRRELSRKGLAFASAIGVLAVLGGGVVGFVTTLAIVVARARAGSYIFALHDLATIRWETVPIVLGMGAGFALAVHHPRALDRAVVWGFVGALGGGVTGIFLGEAMWGSGEGPWAGAIIFADVGLLIAAVASTSAHRPHRGRRPLLAGGLGSVLLLAGAAFLAMGLTNFVTESPPDLPEFEAVPIPEPEDVDAVVFLLGDAGATKADESPLLLALADDVERWSEALARDSAVSIVYLGDLVYPVGVRDRDHPEFATDSSRLWNQIELVGGEAARAHASLGLFLTGNHDWGNTSGLDGLDRIFNLAAQVETARSAGRHVSLQPPEGRPGPAIRDLRRNVRLVFFDTHWFLQARSAADRDEFFARLEEAVAGSGNREIIMAAHHPYESAGPHGVIVPGYHTGGVAFLLKKSGTLVQDLNSAVYGDFLHRLRALFARTGKPPLVFAGGHDHSLQVLRGGGEYDPRFSLVSGAGSKVSSIGNHPALVWGASRPGYMMLVFREDDAVDLFVIGGEPGRLLCSVPEEEREGCMTEGAGGFEVVYSTSLLGPARSPVAAAEVPEDSAARVTPWQLAGADTLLEEVSEDGVAETVRPAPVSVPERALTADADSVTTTAGRTYPAGPIQRFLLGDLNRHLWRIPLRLPVLDLGSVGGGLEPLELTGGRQTVGLRFRGRDGAQYEFRSIVKDPSRALPDFLTRGVIDEVLDDQMAAQFPLAALPVAELSEAAAILAPQPYPAVMPNDARLGRYRALFAGRVGLFSRRPDEGEDGSPGFAGYTRIVGSDDIYRIMREDPSSRFDAEYFLRVRMLDFLVGDWDRHSGQWRWAARTEGGTTTWRAIPEDRDWAFVRIDGLLPAVGRLAMPKYVSFGPNFPAPEHLAHSGYRIDHRVMNGLQREDFLEAARLVQEAVTDSAIARAIAVLPDDYREHVADELARSLRARRAELPTFALRFYDIFARTVHVYGYEDSADVVEFERVSDERAVVRVRSGAGEAEGGGSVRFERVVDGRDTERVRLFIDEGEDRVMGAEDLPFDVEIDAIEPAAGGGDGVPDADDADEEESGPADGIDRDY